jgi:hypothetical protein
MVFFVPYVSFVAIVVIGVIPTERKSDSFGESPPEPPGAGRNPGYPYSGQQGYPYQCSGRPGSYPRQPGGVSAAAGPVSPGRPAVFAWP